MVDRTQFSEFQEYVQALLLYKQIKSAYPKFLERFGHWRTSKNPLERAKFYDEKEKNSQVCKDYYAVKKRYKETIARAELEARGYNLSATALAEIAAIEIPVSMQDIINSGKSVAKEATHLLNPEVRRTLREIAIRDGLEIKPEWIETEEEIAQASESEYSSNLDSASDVEAESEFDNGFDKL
jgi:hypothetical protein